MWHVARDQRKTMLPADCGSVVALRLSSQHRFFLEWFRGLLEPPFSTPARRERFMCLMFTLPALKLPSERQDAGGGRGQERPAPGPDPVAGEEGEGVRLPVLLSYPQRDRGSAVLVKANRAQQQRTF